jgi:HK97 gp10 family phage protein
MFSVKVHAQSCIDGLNRFKGKADRAVPQLEKAFVDTAYEAARRYVPVDTGHLRDSITKHTDSLSVDADYAASVEYGTASQPPQPYFTPAIGEGKQAIRDKFREVL